jgi:hypothetical protein
MPRSSSLSPATYPSRVDPWIIGVTVTPAVVAVVTLSLAYARTGAIQAIYPLFALLLAGAVVIWVMLTTRYRVSGRDITIRSGPFRWRIPLSEIRSIEPASGFMALRSGPALSMQRLVITYREGRQLLISPEDQQRFIADVRSRQ